MSLKERYERGKAMLLNDSSICSGNRQLFKEFFEFEEYKLKRKSGISKLDDPCYKTLNGYLGKLRTANVWLANKPWRELTKADIKRVYDALEDGRIKNRSGQIYADRSGYYNKIFKGKPFRMAGKAELAREVMEFSTTTADRQVRFVTEEEFHKLIGVLKKPQHLALFWLAWDVGENIRPAFLLAAVKCSFRPRKMGARRACHAIWFQARCFSSRLAIS